MGKANAKAKEGVKKKVGSPAIAGAPHEQTPNAGVNAAQAALNRVPTTELPASNGKGADFEENEIERQLTDEQEKNRRAHYMRFLRSLRSHALIYTQHAYVLEILVRN